MKKSSVLCRFVSVFSILALSPTIVNATEELKIASTGAGLSTLPLEIAACRSWADGGVVSDAAVQSLVDHSMLELKSKDPVPLDKLRKWSFAEQAQRELGSGGIGR